MSGDDMHPAWKAKRDLAQVRRRLGGHGPKVDLGEKTMERRILGVARRWQDGLPTPGWDIEMVSGVGVYLRERTRVPHPEGPLQGFVPLDVLSR
jgi:hypothetical protein